MATVASKGYEYPLTPQGTLIPRLHEKWSRGEQIVCSDLAVGYKLTDEHMLFLRDMLEEMSGDWAILNREFPYDWQVAFQTAGRKLIPSNVMDKLESKARDPLPGDQGRGEYVAHQTHGGRSVPRWQPRRDGRVHRFELPREKSTYLVWADPSSGAGEDPTGAGVYRIEHRKLILVASFEGYERPHSMARILARVGRHYRDGLILVPATKALKDGRPCEIGPERNGFGEHLIHELTQNLKYKRVCRYTDKGKDNWKGGHEYGFPTRKDTKMPMLQHLVAMAYDEQLEIPCRRVLTSLRGMQYLDDLDQTAGAPKGMHDDLAMGAGVGAYFAAMKPEFRFAQREEQPEWLRNRLAPEFDRSG